MKPKHLLTILLTTITIFLFSKGNIFAQEDNIKYMNGKITEIVEEKEIEHKETKEKQLYQKIKILVTKGDKKGEEIISENGTQPMGHTNKYRVGDEILISQMIDAEGNEIYYIVDYIRTKSLGILFAIFTVLAVLVGRKKGFLSLLSMALSFLIIFVFLLPQIEQGKDPILITILTSMIIIPITFYLSHGFNKKTTIAIVGTIIALIITGILSVIFSNLVHLSGAESEEVLFLQGMNNTTYNLKGLLLAGILIGTLGIMDDITISQTSIVHQLYDLKKDISTKELFKRSLELGRDHIASMINTLILVYAGASMPLLLLFLSDDRTFSEVISLEVVSTEIVRTLVGSIGLILAVPITTYLACYFVKKLQQNKKITN
ncbi:MAG TPA: YibE/F family protein [Candidatus Dojkabacteria bacterium]|nr:YibE/F family protein [Candidatus Dojkabacteria bacterium]